MVVAESRYIAEDAVEDIVSSWSPFRPSSTWRRPWSPARPWCTTTWTLTWPPTWSRERAIMRRPRPRPTWWSPGASHRSLRGGRHGEPGHRRPLGAQEPAVDAVGHHPGTHPHSQRAGGHVRPVGEPGAGHRALCRGRLRAQDHDVLPGGGPAHLGHPQAGPADQVDRGPARELFATTRSAARSTTARSPSRRTGASWASGTASCTTRAPTTPTA
jgi:hypothetical protein